MDYYEIVLTTAQWMKLADAVSGSSGWRVLHMQARIENTNDHGLVVTFVME